MVEEIFTTSLLGKKAVTGYSIQLEKQRLERSLIGQTSLISSVTPRPTLNKQNNLSHWHSVLKCKQLTLYIRFTEKCRHSFMFLASLPNFHQMTVRKMAMMSTRPLVTRYAMGRKWFLPPNHVTVDSTTCFLPLKCCTGKSDTKVKETQIKIWTELT